MTNGNTRPFLILNIPYVSQNDKFPSVSSEVGISPKTTIDFVSRTYTGGMIWLMDRKSIQNASKVHVILYLSTSWINNHYCDVIMGEMASQTTSLTTVYSTVHSGPDQRKHQSSASLAFVRGIQRWPLNSPHKWSVTRKMFPYDDVTKIDTEDMVCYFG